MTGMWIKDGECFYEIKHIEIVATRDCYKTAATVVRNKRVSTVMLDNGFELLQYHEMEDAERKIRDDKSRSTTPVSP